MDWPDLIQIEIYISIAWAAFVFAPIFVLIYGDIEALINFNIVKIQFLIVFIMRIIILAVLVYIVENDYRVFLFDFILLVILGVILGLCLKFSNNIELKQRSKSKGVLRNNVISNEEIPPKAISKDESKIRVSRSKIISNQKEYLKDNYNLGRAENNGANSGGEYSNRVTISNHSNEGVYMNRDANTTVKELCTYCGEEIKSDFLYCPACGKPIVSKMIQDTDGFK